MGETLKQIRRPLTDSAGRLLAERHHGVTTTRQKGIGGIATRLHDA